jgi:succinate dehydrogenase hydrophobic anchor subunit
METNVLISAIVLLLLSGIMVFAYIMHNSAIYPYKMDEFDEDEQSIKIFLTVMLTSFFILIIIGGIMLYEYCKIIF